MKTVLVADDDYALRKGITLMLRGNGYIVFEANDGLTCLQMMNNNSIELVLLDLFLPGIDGLEIAEKIHSQKPSTKILLLTAHGENARAKQAREIFGNNYLEKISLNEILLKKVEEILK